MSDRQFERAVHDWLEDGSDRTPPAAIQAVLFAIRTTPQQRDLRIPRRFTQMPNYLRYAAAAAIIAIVGVGVLAFSGRTPSVGTGGPSPTPTIAPTPNTPGITGWTTYTSKIYGITIGYPDHWTVDSAATRKWQPGDGPESFTYMDVLMNPETRDGDQIGVGVFQKPAGPGADITSREGLAAWAEANFCDAAIDACQTVPNVAMPMCDGRVACLPAVLVPLSDSTTAFIADPQNGLVTIVSILRPDNFPAAGRYGGAVQLLKSILTTMDVWTPQPGQIPAAS